MVQIYLLKMLVFRYLVLSSEVNYFSCIEMLFRHLCWQMVNSLKFSSMGSEMFFELPALPVPFGWGGKSGDGSLHLQCNIYSAILTLLTLLSGLVISSLIYIPLFEIDDWSFDSTFVFLELWLFTYLDGVVTPLVFLCIPRFNLDSFWCRQDTTIRCLLKKVRLRVGFCRCPVFFVW